MHNIPDLNHSEREILQTLAHIAASQSIPTILAAVDRHQSDARLASATNGMINMPLMDALAKTIHQALGRVSDNRDHVLWLKAAALYFVHCDDDEHDFDSPIGFDDDTEVLNACLRFCGMHELCVKIEDYDAN